MEGADRIAAAYQTARALVEKYHCKQVVHSTRDIEAFLRDPTGDAAAKEAAGQAAARLLQEGRIYVGGDADSYRAAVRSKGLVSCEEYSIAAMLRAHPELSIAAIRRGGTEFLVDDEGAYALS
jgi:hypothetical protein